MLFSHLVMSDSLWPHGPYSTPGFPVLHYLLEFPQTHIHWIDDSIQPSHPLSPPSPPALSLSQHQGLFERVGSLHQVATIRELQLQHQSFQGRNIQGWFPWGLTDLSPCSPRDSQESSPAPHFESINSLLLSLLYGPPLTYIHRYWKKHSFDYMDLCQQWCLCFLTRHLGLS